MKTTLLASTALLALATALPAHAQSAALAAETVIVTAAGNPGDPPVVADARERLSRTPGAVSVVAAESFENRLATGFPDMMRDVPGVLTNKRYGEESRLSIRGSGLDQSFHQRGVLLAQDGVPFADADGFSDFQKVDAQTARYVEVYKGGNALRFGGAQLGGAINMVTATGKTATAENLLRLEGGAFGTFRGQVAVARDYDGFDFYASASGLVADGFRVQSAQSQARATVNAGYSFGEEQEVRLILYGAEIDQQVPGAVNLASALNTPQAPGANVVTNKWARDQQVARASLQTRWRFNENLVFEGGVYTTGTALYHPISIVIQQNIHTQGAFGRFDWTGDIAGHRADLFAGVAYRQGSNNSRLYNNVGGNMGFKFGDAHQEASGTDVFAEGRFFVTDTLALVAGASWGMATRDYINNLNAANNANKDFEWFAPRLGLIWENDSGVQVYANVTRSVEPPHYGALVQSPFPGFVPVAAQRAWTGEVGTRGRSGDLLWDVTFYRASVKGELLSFVPTAGLPAAVFNADSTIHQGIEASLDWDLGADLLGGPLRLRQTWAWSDFAFDGDKVYGDNRLPVAPEHQYRLSLRYDDPSGYFLEPGIDWRPVSTFVDYANTLKAPGYVLFNMGAGYRFSDSLSLFLDLRNLADEHYAAEFGSVTDARIAQTAVFFPGEGRTIYAGIGYKF
jgi:iron complex outermembrane receptor protein